MSLLVNAMRQAGESEPTLRELAEELSLELSPEPAAAVRSVTAGKTTGSGDVKQQGAAGLFAAMEPHAGSHHHTMAALSVVALLLFAGGGAYVYQTINPLGLAPIAQSISQPSQAMPSVPRVEEQPSAAGDAVTPASAQPEVYEEQPEFFNRTGAGPREGAGNSQAAPDNAIKVQRGGAGEINPELAAAYQSLQEGRLDAAEMYYQHLLQQQPDHVDALLGMAAVRARMNQIGDVGRFYLLVLKVEPKNIYAQAGLLYLIGVSDPTGSEDRLIQLLTEMKAGFLYFALGNLYAAQRRWPEAQQAYFQAYHLQSTNPDHAFNLAVSLEQISQPGAALTYYLLALQLHRQGAGFERAAVEARIAQLQKAAS